MKRTVFLLSLALILTFVASLTSSAAVHIGSLDDVQIATKRPTMATGPPDIAMIQVDQQTQMTQFDSSIPTINAHKTLGEGPHTFTAMIKEQTIPRLRERESREYMDAYRLPRDGI